MAKISAKKEKIYVPDEIRSRPLRFIFFPLLVVLMFMFFWFVFTTVIYSQFIYTETNWSPVWGLLYWILAFVLFLVALSILVCLWRCKRGDQGEEAYIIVKSSSKLPNNDIELNSYYQYDSVKEEKENVMNETHPNYDECRKRPENLVISERPTSCLSAREEFFKDLIEQANQNRSSMIETFLKFERQNSQPYEEAQPKTPTEFFVANVATTPTIKSEVTIFVDDCVNDKPVIQVLIPKKALN